MCKHVYKKNNVSTCTTEQGRTGVCVCKNICVSIQVYIQVCVCVCVCIQVCVCVFSQFSFT